MFKRKRRPEDQQVIDAMRRSNNELTKQVMKLTVENEELKRKLAKRRWHNG